MIGIIPKISWAYRIIVAAVVAVVAGVGWVSGSLVADYASDDKWGFIWFLWKVYWPEVLACLLIALMCMASLALLMPYMKNKNKFADAVYRCRCLCSAVSKVERIVFGAFVATLIVGSAALVSYRLYKIIGSEFVFANARLKNWYGASLQVEANKIIASGAYLKAAESLQSQSETIGEIEEAKTSRGVSIWIKKNVEIAGQMLEAAQIRTKAAGTSRSDLLLQGILGAMRPTWKPGDYPQTEINGIEELDTYKAKLIDAKGRCANGGSDKLTENDVAHAISALGFARWPQLLYKESAPLIDRVGVLCRAVKNMSMDDLEDAQRAAFSVSRAPIRIDWRDGISYEEVGTKFAIVWVAVKRAFLAPFLLFHIRLYESPSVAELRGLYGTSSPEVKIELGEMRGLHAVNDDSYESADFDRNVGGDRETFRPITYVRTDGSFGGAAIYTFYSDGERGLLICRDAVSSSPAVAVEVFHGVGGAWMKKSNKCKFGVGGVALSPVDVGASVVPLLYIIMELDKTSSKNPLDRGGIVRSAICQSIKHASESSSGKLPNGFVQICPVESARAVLAGARKYRKDVQDESGGEEGSSSQ